MGDADLREWCKDQLQQRLGFAESAVTSARPVAFVHTLGRLVCGLCAGAGEEEQGPDGASGAAGRPRYATSPQPRKRRQSFKPLHPAVAGGLPADGGTEQFARELYQRVPRQQAERAYQRQERSAAEFARRNEQYTLLEPSREELDVRFLPPPPLLLCQSATTWAKTGPRGLGGDAGGGGRGATAAEEKGPPSA
eukprot:scaffold5640_cov328-Prasinococcus_capsulatus_cf.AAC.5